VDLVIPKSVELRDFSHAGSELRFSDWLMPIDESTSWA
jgi:hypothetical protein